MFFCESRGNITLQEMLKSRIHVLSNRIEMSAIATEMVQLDSQAVPKINWHKKMTNRINKYYLPK